MTISSEFLFGVVVGLLLAIAAKRFASQLAFTVINQVKGGTKTLPPADPLPLHQLHHSARAIVLALPRRYAECHSEWALLKQLYPVYGGFSDQELECMLHQATEWLKHNQHYA